MLPARDGGQRTEGGERRGQDGGGGRQHAAEPSDPETEARDGFAHSLTPPPPPTRGFHLRVGNPCQCLRPSTSESPAFSSSSRLIPSRCPNSCLLHCPSSPRCPATHQRTSMAPRDLPTNPAPPLACHPIPFLTLRIDSHQRTGLQTDRLPLSAQCRNPHWPTAPS